MNEGQFYKQVEKIALDKGWELYHAPFNKGALRQPGFPDLVLVREKVLFRELKTERGELSRMQKKWINKLKKAGADVKVWRPSDLEEIKIELEDWVKFYCKTKKCQFNLDRRESILNERESFLKDLGVDLKERESNLDIRQRWIEDKEYSLDIESETDF